MQDGHRHQAAARQRKALIDHICEKIRKALIAYYALLKTDRYQVLQGPQARPAHVIWLSADTEQVTEKETEASFPWPGSLGAKQQEIPLGRTYMESLLLLHFLPPFLMDCMVPKKSMSCFLLMGNPILSSGGTLQNSSSACLFLSPLLANGRRGARHERVENCSVNTQFLLHCLIKPWQQVGSCCSLCQHSHLLSSLCCPATPQLSLLHKLFGRPAWETGLGTGSNQMQKVQTPARVSKCYIKHKE